MPGHTLWSSGLILLGDLFVLLSQYFIKFPAKSLGWVQALWFTVVCTAPYCRARGCFSCPQGAIGVCGPCSGSSCALADQVYGRPWPLYTLRSPLTYLPYVYLQSRSCIISVSPRSLFRLFWFLVNSLFPLFPRCVIHKYGGGLLRRWSLEGVLTMLL